MTGQEVGELVVKLVTVLVPLGMFYVGYRTLRLAYQNTNAHFRQKLYEKQLEGATELYAAVGNLTDKALGWVFDTNVVPRERYDHVLTLVPKTAEASQALDKVVSKYRLCMPSDVNTAVLEYCQVVARATDPNNKVMIRPHPAVTPPPLLRVIEADFRVLQRLRACIGTDALSDAVRKSFGKLPEERRFPPNIEFRDAPAATLPSAPAT